MDRLSNATKQEKVRNGKENPALVIRQQKNFSSPWQMLRGQTPWQEAIGISSSVGTGGAAKDSMESFKRDLHIDFSTGKKGH